MSFEYHSRLRLRKRLVTFLAVTVLCVIIGSTLVLATERAAGADVTVTARIRPAVSATFEQHQVTVYANTPWVLEVAGETNDGAHPVAVRRPPTGSKGSIVEIEAGQTVVGIVADDG